MQATDLRRDLFRQLDRIASDRVPLEISRHGRPRAPATRATLNFDEPDALENDLLLQHLRARRTGTAARARQKVGPRSPPIRCGSTSVPRRR